MKKLQQRLNADEDGFTLVEYVVAIILLGILALAAAPSFIQSLNLINYNNMVTSSNVTVSEIVEGLRAQPSCENISSTQASLATAFKDGRGHEYHVELEATDSVTPCAPNKVNNFIITVTRDKDDKVLFTEELGIFVPSSNNMIQVTG